MRRLLPFAAVFLLACSNDLTPADSGYSPGELGNGGFAFSCDDSVVCGKFNSAEDFPKNGIARGSTFRLRYVPRTGYSGDAVGVTLATVGNTYFSITSGTFLALTPGQGSVVAYDNTGSVLEYKTLAIYTPDKIVVYDGEDTTTTSPIPISTIDLSVSDVRTFRALAQKSNLDLAGALKYEWRETGSAALLTVSSDNTGKVSVRANKTGTTTLEVTGATFTQQVSVTVR